MLELGSLEYIFEVRSLAKVRIPRSDLRDGYPPLIFPNRFTQKITLRKEHILLSKSVIVLLLFLFISMGKKRKTQVTDQTSLSRKDRRKEERLAKKSRRNQRNHLSSNKYEFEPTTAPPRINSNLSQEPKSILKKKTKSIKIESKQSNIEEDPYGHLDPATAAAMRADDAEIAMLEEKLALSSKSKKGGKEKLYREYSKLEGLGDEFGDFMEDLDRIASGDLGSGKGQTFSLQNQIDSSDGSENEVYSGQREVDFEKDDTDDSMSYNSDNVGTEPTAKGSNEASDSELSGSEEESIDEETDAEDDTGKDDDHKEEDVYRPSVGEDIYGNQIDSEKSSAKPSKYVPPHLRKKLLEEDRDDSNHSTEKYLSDKQTLSRIKRDLNGMMNRLSEETLDSITKQLVRLYRDSSVNDVNSCVLTKLTEACVHQRQIMITLIPSFCALLAAVHIHVGNDVGGFLLESLVLKFIETQNDARKTVSTDEAGYSKECSNCILLISYLYNFQVVHCTLMYDIIRDLIDSFQEVDVELLLLLLSHCGFQLRSDDPSALKDIVILVQERAIQTSLNEKGGTEIDKEASISRASPSRIKYMIEAITDLKNNKKYRKDEERIAKITRFRKFVGRSKSTAFAGKGSGDSCMRVTLKDILDIGQKGRWWKVGASWVGNQYSQSVDEKRKPLASDRQQESGMLKLAAKQHMNTDIRRSIFCILMGSSDCDDAFEKLVRLNLRGKQDREIIRVLVHCCGQEKSYNPFYAFLAIRICQFQSKAKFTLQLSIWDLFKQMNDMKARKAANIGKLCAHLLQENLLSCNVLKPLDMSNLVENEVVFVTIFMSHLFDNAGDSSQIGNIFNSIPKNNEEGIALKQGITIFSQKYLKEHPKNQKKSHFRSCFKALLKACETDDVFS